MKCRNCGQLLENGSRFCTYCDCDNYPDMNRVKTKPTHITHTNNTYQTGKMEPQRQTNTRKNKKSGGVSVFVVFLIIVYILLMLVSNVVAD